MTILEQIINYKKQALNRTQAHASVKDLKKSIFFDRQPYSLKMILKTASWGIIAEFKRASPSQSNLNLQARPEDICLNYDRKGASGLSIITDNGLFKGSNEDISNIRKKIQKPILRKDFIFSSYQVYETKAIGADLILLIAAVLSAQEVQKLANLAHSLGLEVLLEVHNLNEMRTHFEPNHKVIDILGINNRNLKTFQTSLQTALDLSPYIPATTVAIAESGMTSPQDVKTLRAVGYRGFLIGTYFMKSQNPGQTFITFMQNLSNN